MNQDNKASAAWSFNFKLERSSLKWRKIPPASAAWSFNFKLETVFTEMAEDTTDFSRVEFQFQARNGLY